MALRTNINNRLRGGGDGSHRFEVSDTFACCMPGLRAQQALLLEDETRANQQTTRYCKYYSDDLD
jgi:hypothetical protein